MKTLYIECNMGAAGDMLTAALLELCPDPDAFIEKMNTLGIPKVRVSRSAVSKCGIRGTGISVKVGGVEEGEAHPDDNTHHHADGHDHQSHESSHHHASLGNISALIKSLAVSDTVKTHAMAVYSLIAEAESYAHSVPVSEIYFHEVGALDAVADIVGVCLLMEMLAPEQIIASPVHVGSGQVRTAHGILPVPAPATAYILKGIPFYSSGIKGELCTPTGAALLKHYAVSFSNMPVMQVEKIGYGMGKKDFEAVNCVRMFLGETVDGSEYKDEVIQLSCNLDDMTPEAIAFAMQTLLDSGSLDVFSVPIFMKKNRPAYMLVCLCSPDRAPEMAQLMLKHTSTNGVRQVGCSRYKLKSEFEQHNTPFGLVRMKISSGYGIVKSKPEYADVEKFAKESNAPFETVYRSILGDFSNVKTSTEEK